MDTWIPVQAGLGNTVKKIIWSIAWVLIYSTGREDREQVLKLDVHRQALREDPEEAEQLQIHLLFQVS